MSHSSGIPDFLRIDITHAEGTDSFDPNTITIRMIEEPEYLSSLKSTGDISILSAEPGVIYKTDEFEACLTAGEIGRLTMRALTPSEFKGLRRAFKGQRIHEIHDDFYDQDTGEAMQPKV